jgi:hypothetical protein
VPPTDDDFYYYQPGVAKVTWDSEHSMVFVDWEGWANETEFAALLEAGVRALIDHGGSRWLADCRRERVLSTASSARADAEWLPRAARAGLKRFALVLPDSGLAASNLRAREATLSTRLEVGYFATVDEAREWLARP